MNGDNGVVIGNNVLEDEVTIEGTPNVHDEPVIGNNGDTYTSPCSDKKILVDGEKIVPWDIGFTTLPYVERYKNISEYNDSDIDVDKLPMTTLMGIQILTADDNVNGVRDELYSGKQQKYMNHPKYGEVDITPQRVKIGSKNDSNVKSNDLALLRAQQAMGLQGRTAIPLYNSGFWIIMDAVSDTDLIMLENALSNNDLTLGRFTNGAIYSNDGLIYEEIIRDFVHQRLVSSNLDVSLEDIFDYVVSEDYDIIVTSLAAAFYPFGFLAHIPCSDMLVPYNGGSKCNNIYSFKVDPMNMIHVERDRFTSETRKIFASKKQGSVSIEDINEYQRQLLINVKDTLTVKLHNDTVTIKLKSASLNNKVTLGTMWIDNVTEKVNEMMSNSDSEISEAMLLNDFGKQKRLNTYIHYIDTVTYVSDSTTVEHTSPEAMMTTLTSFSSNEDVLETIGLGIKQYLKDKVVTIVGVPEFTCECGKRNTVRDEDDDTNMLDIVPKDPTRLFFQLVVTRLEAQKNKITTV